jgi:hypothetical protein
LLSGAFLAAWAAMKLQAGAHQRALPALSPAE